MYYASSFVYGAGGANNSANNATNSTNDKMSDLCRKCAVQEWIVRHQNSLAIAEQDSENDDEEEESGDPKSGSKSVNNNRNKGCKSVQQQGNSFVEGTEEVGKNII